MAFRWDVVSSRCCFSVCGRSRTSDRKIGLFLRIYIKDREIGRGDSLLRRKVRGQVGKVCRFVGRRRY